MKNILYLTLSFIFILVISCEKYEDIGTEIISNDALDFRLELQDKGYTESIVDSINKQECYFEEWKKTVLTPVSGLIEFYDSDSNWDLLVFPESPEGEQKFSVFSFYKKDK